MASWVGLARELDRWAVAGERATLWWRDDDAQTTEPALDRLLDVAAAGGVPVAVAVIPALAGPQLARRLGACPLARVVQHGWRHRNHAPIDAKKSELGAERPLGEVLGDVRRGRSRLHELFGPELLDVLVPPWNRIRADLLPELPELGIRVLSTFETRSSAAPTRGLSQTNTHVDIIDWRAGRGFRGEQAILHDLVSHLAARRAGAVDAMEPTGILSHHRVHDRRCWSFLAELIHRVQLHHAAQWLDPCALARPR